MEITQKSWQAFITTLERLNKTAAAKMTAYLNKIGGWSGHEKDVIDYAFALVSKYGEGAAALAAEMYDITAETQGVKISPAIPAKTATVEEVTDYLYRVAAFSEKTIPNGVSRMVKQAGADTTLQNAKRDGAEFAWIPHGDTCAFCLTLASNGWRRASKKTMRGDHASHIHANCNCEFAVRFDGKSGVNGYDPDKYKRIYDEAEGNNSKEKINSIRREMYAKSEVALKNNNSIIKIDIQFFAEKDLKNQSSGSIKRGINSLRKQIEDHEKKIDSPQQYVPDWNNKIQQEKEGLIRHWNKEIRDFKESIENRIKELMERGDYDE